ncbi:hypothetical protein CS542_02465 [Pedobacter sp. IW39]|nr:hypothetical protein CS542_02465 [Pedobacter sp. IW39]
MKTAGLDADGIPQFIQDGKVVSVKTSINYDPYADFFTDATASSLTNKEYQGCYLQVIEILNIQEV